MRDHILPTELWDQIFRDLSFRDLKNCRLSCKEVEPSATQLLFRTIYLTLSVASVNGFRNVANSDALRIHVSAIVWDDCQIHLSWREMMRWKELPNVKFVNRLPPGHKQVVAEVYKRLMLDQEHLRKSQEPKTLLVDNIHRFPLLKRIDISQKERHSTHLESCTPSEAFASGCLLSLPTWATSPSFFPQVSHKSSLSYAAVFEALAGPVVDDVQLRYPPRQPRSKAEGMNLDLDFFCAKEVLQPSPALIRLKTHSFRFLRIITLTVDGSIAALTGELRRSNLSTEWFDISAFDPAPFLRHLHLKFIDSGAYPPEFDSPNLILHLSSFPSLTHISIDGWNCSAFQLIAFFYNHKPVLRSITISNMKLIKGHWSHVLHYVKKVLRWHEVILQRVVDRHSIAYPDDRPEGPIVAVRDYLRGLTDECPFVDGTEETATDSENDNDSVEGEHP